MLRAERNRDAQRVQRHHPRSGCAAIAVMQPANLRNRDHPTTVRWLNIASNRRVAIERHVRASVMVVVEVVGEDPSEVAFVENDTVIKALATDRSDDSLDVR